MTDAKIMTFNDDYGDTPEEGQRLCSDLVKELLIDGFSKMTPYDIVVHLRKLCRVNVKVHADLTNAKAQIGRLKRLLQADSDATSAVAGKRKVYGNLGYHKDSPKPPPAKRKKSNKKRVVIDLSQSTKTKNNVLIESPYKTPQNLKKPPPIESKLSEITNKIHWPTPTPKKAKQVMEKPIDVDVAAEAKKAADRKKEVDEEWEKYEQSKLQQRTMTQIYLPMLEIPDAQPEYDFLTQARI